MSKSGTEADIAATRSRWKRPAVAALTTAIVLSVVFAATASARASGGVDRAASLGHGVTRGIAQGGLWASWRALVYLSVALVLLTVALALRSVRRASPLPAAGFPGALEAARALVDRHGEDSLAPFILRPDKTFEFVAGGVAAYRVIGRTAVVSGDPIGPRGAGPAVLGGFLAAARTRGLRVAVYGSARDHVDQYRRMGLRALQVGEEAVVDPARFTLQGRPVRKLRQSVHRVARRGWVLTACDGRLISAELEREMEALERCWRAGRRRLLGFAMAMGEFDSEVGPRDLYLLARSPEGELRAVMRFIAHRGKLTLDTMRRVGETPNGLNEALVCRALEVARERGVREVSLNYAGLGHLVRTGPSGGPVRRGLTGALLWLLGRRFQMERLVRFNEKFSPCWRPRYLVYESRRALPGSVIRVLQAEGYLPRRKRRSGLGRRSPSRLVEPRPGVQVRARVGR